MSNDQSAPTQNEGPGETVYKVNKLAVAVACILVVILVAAVVGGLVKFRPQAEKEARAKVIPALRVTDVVVGPIEVTVDSQGTVMAKTETDLASEVAGRVIWVAESFQRGGSFSEGDELLRIERTNYEAALAAAVAEVVDAKLALELERAKAKQARRDWEKLGKGAPPTPLVLREPQLASAAARESAAQAAESKARRDLEQTVVRAPYDGRVRSTSTDLGSYVTAGSPLASTFASSSFEIALPLSIADFDFLAENSKESPVQVELSRGGRQTWEAKLDRIVGEIDDSTRTVTVIATIVDDGAPGAAGPVFLGPGLFLQASIEGKTFADTISLPRAAMFDPDTVLTVDDENTLRFKNVKVKRFERDRVLIEEGVSAGERVVLTPLSAPIEGMKVQIIEDEPDDEAAEGDVASGIPN